MDNPEFSIGEMVAVFSKNLLIVIPCTTVTGYKFFKAGLYIADGNVNDLVTNKVSQYFYTVADNSIYYFHKQNLRKIKPNEYLEEFEEEVLEVE